MLKRIITIFLFLSFLSGFSQEKEPHYMFLNHQHYLGTHIDSTGKRIIFDLVFFPIANTSNYEIRFKKAVNWNTYIYNVVDTIHFDVQTLEESTMLIRGNKKKSFIYSVNKKNHNYKIEISYSPYINSTHAMIYGEMKGEKFTSNLMFNK